MLFSSHIFASITSLVHISVIKTATTKPVEKNTRAKRGRSKADDEGRFSPCSVFTCPILMSLGLQFLIVVSAS